MTDINPLLEDSDLPDFAAIRPDHVVPAVEQAIADHKRAIDAMTASGADSFDAVMLAAERADFALSRTWSPVGHLASVADTPELRAAHADAQAKLTAYMMEAGQNRDQQQAVARVAARPDFASLPVAQRRAVDLALRGFHLAGVALEGEARQRFLEIGVELGQLSTAFGNAVMDATEAWSEHITDEALLDGVPESDRAILAAYAAEKGLDGWLVALRQPSVLAILYHARNRDLRARVYRANATRASDQADDMSFDNSDRIEAIMRLRHEAAGILGFADAAAHSLETKMAEDADEALAFLADLAKRARPVAERELAESRAFAADRLGLDDLQPWDVNFVGEAMRRTLHGVDQQQIRPYFPLPRVLAGTQALIHNLFGVTLRERTGVSTWHRDAIFYDLVDADGAVVAGVYCDLFARAGKRGGAWMDVCRSRFRDADRLHRPIAYLTTNFAPPAGDQPSLLTHDDVVTLFHEFGHVLHHLLTQVDIPSIGGISGVEWDAVELPSQFMENFAWDRDTLVALSGHVEHGGPLPDALFDAMLAARQFQSGLAILRQIEFATFDLRLHRDYDPVEGARVNQMLAEVRAAVAVIQPPEWNRFAHGFGHIFAGGYAAGYYSYLWAELLSADAFELFAHGDLPGGGASAFRREILAAGASRSAAENFEAFAGRPPQIDALLRLRGLAA
ncbi:oligopeptidase A [Sphingobium fontiphilum]|uniref:oligopeptidase A n=1 Tax=Sphingobium fontiphilum TaxID=944425 RepID=A0A7W6GMJ6_9SPHN|nr:M3 family metallopeptidase [Sphingobium fontiphilum]MBB3981271.1 oligopeptidase A [Sphingobium fontiphilum]